MWVQREFELLVPIYEMKSHAKINCIREADAIIISVLFKMYVTLNVSRNSKCYIYKLKCTIRSQFVTILVVVLPSQPSASQCCQSKQFQFSLRVGAYHRQLSSQERVDRGTSDCTHGLCHLRSVPHTVPCHVWSVFDLVPHTVPCHAWSVFDLVWSQHVRPRMIAF